MFGCMLNALKFPRNFSRCCIVVIMALHLYFLCPLLLISLLHKVIKDIWLASLQDLENSEYYCPECQGKVNCKVLAPKTHKSKIKYVVITCCFIFPSILVSLLFYHFGNYPKRLSWLVKTNISIVLYIIFEVSNTTLMREPFGIEA